MNKSERADVGQLHPSNKAHSQDDLPAAIRKPAVGVIAPSLERIFGGEGNRQTGELELLKIDGKRDAATTRPYLPLA